MLGDSMRRRGRKPVPERHEKERDPGRAARWGRWLIWALGVGLVAFGAGYLVAVLVLFPAPKQEGVGVAVPDLVGQTREEAQQELRALGLRLAEVVEIEHEDVRDGEVVAQQPLAGQHLRVGAGVRLAVSSGQPQVAVPSVLGLGADQATMLLERLGFAVTRRDSIRAGPRGSVLAVEPAPGTRRTLPSVVALTVSVPPPDPVMDSLEAGPVPGLDGPGPRATSDTTPTGGGS